MKPKPGKIWLADLGLAAKRRPALIVSRHDPDPPRVLASYVPLTTQYRGSRYEVELGKLPFLDQPSVANVQGLGSLPEAHLAGCGKTQKYSFSVIPAQAGIQKVIENIEGEFPGLPLSRE